MGQELLVFQEIFSLEMQTLGDPAPELGHSIPVLFLYDFLYITFNLTGCDFTAVRNSDQSWSGCFMSSAAVRFMSRNIAKPHLCHLKCDMRGE